MLKIKDVLNVELRDDSTDFGGVSFTGEKVKDFIASSGLVVNVEDSISVLNKVLHECGIEEIIDIQALDKFTRIDMQGVMENETETLREWYERVLSTMLMEEHINESEFKKRIRDMNPRAWLDTIQSYAEIWEFDFVGVLNNSILSYL